MNIRKPRRRNDKIIDCEVEHPVHGWIPYTACEDDESSLQIYARCLNKEAGAIQEDPFPEKSYKQKREDEYPPIREQLDAIWKGGESEDAMRRQILAIKAKYPKGPK